MVPLPAGIADELAGHLARLAGAELVFTAPEGGPLRVASWRRRFWRPALSRSGLDPRRPYDLRHTAIGLWIDLGASPKQIAMLAGHTSVSFTLDRYGHLFPQRDEGPRERLDEQVYHSARTIRSARDGARQGQDAITPITRGVA